MKQARLSGLAWAALALGTVLSSAPVSDAVSAPAPTPAPASATAAARVDINTAGDAELQTLPRIGPAVAARIVEYRKTVGSFKTVDELLNVKGIGEKTMEVLRPLVTVAAKPAAGKS